VNNPTSILTTTNSDIPLTTITNSVSSPVSAQPITNSNSFYPTNSFVPKSLPSTINNLPLVNFNSSSSSNVTTSIEQPPISDITTTPSSNFLSQLNERNMKLNDQIDILQGNLESLMSQTFGIDTMDNINLDEFLEMSGNLDPEESDKDAFFGLIDTGDMDSLSSNDDQSLLITDINNDNNHNNHNNDKNHHHQNANLSSSTLSQCQPPRPSSSSSSTSTSTSLRNGNGLATSSQTAQQINSISSPNPSTPISANDPTFEIDPNIVFNE